MFALPAKKPKKHFKKNNSTNTRVEAFRNSSYSLNNNSSVGLVTITEYRNILHDNNSSDEQIQKRLSYLENFCRNIITAEIAKQNSKN